MKKEKIKEHPPRILVLDNGSVLIARCEDIKTPCIGFFLECTEVRYNPSRSASDGLGRLLQVGPPDTTNDIFISREIIPIKSIVRAIDLDVKKWSSLYE